MCLYSRIPKKNRNRIKVYKIVRIYGNDYLGPCTGYLYKEVNIEHNRIWKYLKIFFSGYVDSGFYHSYLDLKEAKERLDYIRKHNGNFYKIIPGIIPPGTIYYQGDYDIASEKLVLKEI